MALIGIYQVSVQDDSELKDFLKKRHSVSNLVVHLVFTTKYRRKLFDGYMIQQLKEAFESACEKLECDLLEMDGEEDHVHLLVSYPPKLSISVMVNNLKAVSSRRLRLLNTHIPMQSTTGRLWSRSYFACSAGDATIETLRAYVEGQKTPE
ncbi:IS200/IS605 family transposase [Zooshikella ganghwensis]|uniref:IS200/IS605 family transposase n=1 Tax=Zooshikella ganghwensis TaxID=202772 RepID=UPI0004205B45|nr:IS200/IS605 family transposase [Zooshikella ganghwensis]